MDFQGEAAAANGGLGGPGGCRSHWAPRCGKGRVTHGSSGSEGPRHLHLVTGWWPVCSETALTPQGQLFCIDDRTPPAWGPAIPAAALPERYHEQASRSCNPQSSPRSSYCSLPPSSQRRDWGKAERVCLHSWYVRGPDSNPQSSQVASTLCCLPWDTRGCWPSSCGPLPVLSFPRPRAATSGGPRPSQTHAGLLVLPVTSWWHFSKLLSSSSLQLWDGVTSSGSPGT